MMDRAQDYYVKGEYETAIQFFDEVLEINAGKVEADFYKGMSYMEIERHEDASESFTRVIEHNDNLFIQQAEWYLAGCLLAMDETDRARRQLAMIASSSNHYYSKDASKILKRMKR
jgi:tetratricopeptide (TPR) repeat protein